MNVPDGQGGYITKWIYSEDLLSGIGNSPIKLQNKSLSFSTSITANTLVTNIYFNIISGTPTVQIGTTSMGTDLLEPMLITSDLPVEMFKYYLATESIYFYVINGSVNIRIDLISNYV